jgi:hypothetical protein
VRRGFERAIRAPRTGHRHGMAAVRSAFRRQQVPPVTSPVEVRPLGRIQPAAGPQCPRLFEGFPGLEVHPHLLDRVRVPGKRHVRGPVRIPGEVGVDAVHRADDGAVTPWPGGVGGREHYAAPAAKEHRDDQVEHADPVAEGRRPDASRRGDVGNPYLFLPRGHMAHPLPALQVRAVVDRQARQVFEGRRNQVVAVRGSGDARVGVEARKDGVGVHPAIVPGRRAPGRPRFQSLEGVLRCPGPSSGP